MHSCSIREHSNTLTLAQMRGEHGEANVCTMGAGPHLVPRIPRSALYKFPWGCWGWWDARGLGLHLGPYRLCEPFLVLDPVPLQGQVIGFPDIWVKELVLNQRARGMPVLEKQLIQLWGGGAGQDQPLQAFLEEPWAFRFMEVLHAGGCWLCCSFLSFWDTYCSPFVTWPLWKPCRNKDGSLTLSLCFVKAQTLGLSASSSHS
jgi:hypothetical protein